MTKACLIGVVLAGMVFAGCSGSQTSTPPAPAPVSTPAPAGALAGAPAEAPPEGAAGGKASPQLLGLLPAKDQVAGWSVVREPRGFTAENLWEQIDGAADSFVAYGVQDVVFADYRQAGTGYEAVIEIYQLKDPLNAFGKYADERYPDYRFVQVGNEGYTGSNLVNFWAGPYYVKIRSFADKAAIRQELMKLAQSVVAKIATPGAEPRELSFFPRKDQVPHSAHYIPKDVLAQSYLTNGFQVEYKAGQKTSKLILMALDSTAAAQGALTRYRESVSKGGKDIHAVMAPGEGGFAGQESFYGNLVAIRVRNYVAVALGTTTEEAGKAQLMELVRNVK